MAKEYWLKFETGNPVTAIGLSPTFTVFKSWTGGVVSPPGITQQIASYGLYRFEFTPSFAIIFVADGATSGLTSANRYVVGTLDPLDLVDERMTEIGATLTALGATLAALGTTSVALGITNVALGTTNIALGTTSVALGITGVALGVTTVALGNTGVALGSTNGLNILAYGITGIALGNTSVAFGTTNGFNILSLLGQGNSSITNLTDVLTRIGSTTSSFGSTSVDPGSVFGFLRRLQELQEGDANFNKSTGVWQIETRGGTLLREKTLANSATAVTKD